MDAKIGAYGAYGAAPGMLTAEQLGQLSALSSGGRSLPPVCSGSGAARAE